jgi:hypothetical protein
MANLIDFPSTKIYSTKNVFLVMYTYVYYSSQLSTVYDI